MNFTEYQIKARATAIYPGQIYYPTLGLCGESGEVAEKIKKVMRDDNGNISPEKRQELKKELGDVLWYLAMLAHDIGLDLQDIAEANIAKLQKRKDTGTLQGSGDNR